MADEENTNEDVEQEAEETQGGGGSTKLLAVGFVASMVVVETFLFFFMVPSSDEVAALVEARLVADAKGEGDEDAEEEEDDENKEVEFNLGMYGETFSPLGTEESYRAEYEIFATLKMKDKTTLSDEFKEKEGRIRHAIRMEIRNSRLEELQDNQLGLIERRVLAKCNSLLDEPFLISIGMKDYQLREE